ncbi:uncharacterized protein TNCV_4617961 [Trichonephila clavipes]|nr:uncharacterized protein TNCV_4617961 [Trichonephila clavipes]
MLAVELGADFREVREQPKQRKNTKGSPPKLTTDDYQLQRLHDTGSVADRKRSGRASFIRKTKMADVETALQRSPLKRPSVYINIITKFISVLNVMKGTLGYSKTAQCVTYHGTDFFPWGYLKNISFRTNPHTFDELKSNILHAIWDINSHALRKVPINLLKRV